MKNLLIIAIALLFIRCEPLVPQQTTVRKALIFDNYDYEDFVGMVKISPLENGQLNELENQVVSLNGSDELFLTFDLLTDQFENLSAKIYHCNKNWSKSRLRDLEFLSQINNFRVVDFDYSVNTVQPYINYRFQIPKPILTGNYVIAISRRANPADVILTRRFIVYENTAQIGHTVRVSTTIDKRDDNHQIEFSIDYGDVLVNTPVKDITPVILQNHNWNTAIVGVDPTLIRMNEGFLEYRHLDLKTNFPGWNEFRFMDIRTLSISGRNVGRISNSGTKISAPLLLNKSRRNETYSLNFQDINGNYVIENNDPGESFLNTDYADVTFFLNSDRISGNVYVIGRFNNWRTEELNKMQFSTQNGVSRYQTTIPMKQGYYEYWYYVESNEVPNYYFEGTHFQTEDEYEILVYYRRPGNINDEVIGYKRFRSIEL